MYGSRSYSAGTKFLRLCRGARLRLWWRLWGANIGKSLEVERGVLLRWGPHPGLSIGNGVYIGRGVVLDVPVGARLIVGSRSKLMHYTVIAAGESITIGHEAQIAEHCSVRDSDHALAAGASMLDQAIVSSPVTIGDDVWVGRGAGVLRGAHLAEGSVIGANSVVKGAVPPFAIAVGTPARVIKHRADPEREQNTGLDDTSR